jgi:hypothetical protein
VALCGATELHAAFREESRTPLLSASAARQEIRGAIGFFVVFSKGNHTSQFLRGHSNCENAPGVASGAGYRHSRCQRTRNGIDVNWKLHIDIPSVSSRLASPGNIWAPGEILQCGALFPRLFVLIVLSASNSQCPYAETEQIPMAASVYTWIAPTGHSLNSLGTLTVSEQDRNSVPLLNPSIHSKAGVLVSRDAQWDDSGARLKITYAAGQALVHVTITLVAHAGAFEATVDADQPVITSVDMGPWSAVLQAQPVVVPYYTGKVWYLPKMAAYVNAWWDWHTTHATKLNGTLAQYLERTDATLPAFHERLLLVLSPDVDATLPAPGNQPSPYMQELSGRMVLDIWTPNFKQIEQGLVELGDYGITDCVGIIHAWQHAGYDNALPQHYPANEAMGGDAGLTAAVNAGKADGCLMALHENYVDYYPNYPRFDASAIALNSDGNWMPSWLNHSTGVQSYWTKPAWMIANAATQSPAIHRRYGTTAAYLDVNSGISPSSHVDMDARAAGAGTLTALLAGDPSLWSYERKTHQGPVFGEGANHWYYSGLLDGVEAQFGAGDVRENQGALAPLFVDFDLERIHPLQVNHGMGYYERWVSHGETVSNTLTMDAYRMQEIAFGHAPFLGGTYWNDVAHALLESNLVTPVARSYGVASVSSIEYQVNDAWESPSVAAKSAAFSRVRVTYDNGLVVVANASRQPLRWQNMVLPQYGWAAKARGLLAYTAMCGATVCDYAETRTSVFANARSQADAGTGTVVSFGAVQTDGMISMREEHGQWVLRPFPRSRDFTVLLQDSKFVMPASVTAEGGSSSLLKPIAEGAYWKLPLTGAKSYSWPAGRNE